MRQIGWDLGGVRKGLNLPPYVIVGTNEDGKPIHAPRERIADHAKSVFIGDDPVHDPATHKVVNGAEADDGSRITIARDLVPLSAEEITAFQIEAKRQVRRTFGGQRGEGYRTEFPKIYDTEFGVDAPLSDIDLIGHLMDAIIEQAEANRVAAGATATAEWTAILAARAKVKRDVPKPS